MGFFLTPAAAEWPSAVAIRTKGCNRILKSSSDDFSGALSQPASSSELYAGAQGYKTRQFSHAS